MAKSKLMETFTVADDKQNQKFLDQSNSKQLIYRYHKLFVTDRQREDGRKVLKLLR